MKIGRYEVTLSRSRRGPVALYAKDTTEKPITSGKEQGSNGVPYQGYFPNERTLGRTKDPTVRQIMDMIDNDGTAQGLYTAITAPPLAAGWHIEPHPQDILMAADGTETHPQADSIDNTFRAPQQEGGMSTPFSLVLADIMLGVAQGHRFFELVYKLNDMGFATFQKIVSREIGSYTILTDETGGFAGVEQMVSDGNGKMVKKTIELPYCFLFTYRKDRDKLKGKTAFRAAFYHYDKKHRLYYLINQQAQQAAVNPKILEETGEGVNEDSKDAKASRDAVLTAVDRMAVRPSIALPFGYKLTIAAPGKSVDMTKDVDHHNVEMARSVLAEGQMLGTMSDSKGGSYNLAESKMDMFMNGEKMLMQSIEEHINAFMINKLIDYNFAQPLYPKFKFNDMDSAIMNLMSEAFKGLVTKGTVPQWVIDGISEKLAEQMEIPKPEDVDEGDDINDDATDTTPEDKQVENSRKKKVGRRLAKSQTSEWWRELTATEAKVQFSAIKQKVEDEQSAALEDLRPVFNKMANDAVTRLKPLLADNGAKALDGFELKFGADIQKVFNDHTINIYSAAKTGAADEIKKKAPANKQTSKDLLKEHSQAIVDKQFGDLLFNLKTIVTDAVRKNLLDTEELSVGEIISKIADMFTEFFDEKEELTVSSLMTMALNVGRDDVFQAYSDKIYGYQYSAILDDVVCKVCEDLDGSVVDESAYFSTIWMPPIHFNCRCIWVAIMDDEEDKPDFQPIPDAPGGTTSPSLSVSHHENSISASIEYQVYLRKREQALWVEKRS